MEHLTNLPKWALVSIKEGTVIVNNRVIHYPSYDGTKDGLLTYYAQMSAIHEWSPQAVAAIVGAIAYDYNRLDASDMSLMPDIIVKEPSILPNKAAKWMGLAFLAMFISINTALLVGDMRIKWDIYLKLLVFIMEGICLYGIIYCFNQFSKQKTH